MKKFLFAFALFLISMGVSKAQSLTSVDYTPKDKEIFLKYAAYIQDKKDLPTGELVIATAKFFLGTPYVVNTLEKEPERLIVNLRELDCTTFVETVFALVKTVKSGDVSFENFFGQLKNIRYRGGVIEDYTSRLHYTSDWIYDNQKRGNLEDMTRKAGGVPVKMNFFIMSSNPDTYKQLKNRPDLVAKIVAQEKELNARKHYYIPADKIDANKNKIENGNMIAFVTTIPGIDVSHMAIAYHEGKKLTFIHASSRDMKVIINDASIADYVKASKRTTGIITSKLK